MRPIISSPLGYCHNRNNGILRCSTITWTGLLTGCCCLLIILSLIDQQHQHQVEGNVLIKVCDSKELKTVISRACMLYKRTKNSDIKMMKSGNIRITRSSKSELSSASKIANDCCSIGCPAHIFAYNC